MLYPIPTKTRTLMDLGGVWNFKLEFDEAPNDPTKPLETDEVMAVPAAFNDQAATASIRNHSGYVWYERTLQIPKILLDERLILRFGAAAHTAEVYINGKLCFAHQGGFLPFEGEINQFVKAGENRLSVRVSNLLDHTTLPVANLKEFTNEAGHKRYKVDENFDFFNYAGLIRPVRLYTTPKVFIHDIVLTSTVEGKNATVDVKTKVVGDAEVRIEILDESNLVVATGDGENTSLQISDVRLWQPGKAYLYTVRVSLYEGDTLLDVYDEPYGIRTVAVQDGQFLINGKAFYFKGFGKHEDTPIHGRGINEAANVLDLSIFKWMGANSYRTSHYPYSEEMMRLSDRLGIVVIDELPAVGQFSGFSALLSGGQMGSTWDEIDTTNAHQSAIKELIARDKNHACVVMWSISNEPASHQEGSFEYFEPLFKMMRDLDPSKRPITYVNIMMGTPDVDLVTPLVDVICLNRYYGWYVANGDLAAGEAGLRAELKAWHEKYPDKPIMMTEYGADTVAGLHSITDIPFTEDYQVAYYEMNHKVFDEFSFFIGEQLWNFADFETKVGVARVQGNKKGIFTRDRRPKAAARSIRKRWLGIENFDYKKNS